MPNNLICLWIQIIKRGVVEELQYYWATWAKEIYFLLDTTDWLVKHVQQDIRRSDRLHRRCTF